MPKRLIYRIVWVPSALACLITLLIFARRPIADAAPGALTTYTSSDKTLQVLHPDNWKPQEVGSGDINSGVRFVGGAYTSIKFTTDLAGSLRADIAKYNNPALNNMPGIGNPSGGGDPSNGSAPMPGSTTDSSAPTDSSASPEAAQTSESQAAGSTQIAANQKSPLQQLHETKGTELQQGQEFPDYHEGQTRQEKIAGIDALVTDFTYTEQGEIGSTAMVGERATALLNDRRLLILARCPKQSGEKLMPIFEKMMDSLKVSPQGG